MYKEIRTARSEYIHVRHHRYHVRVWGEPNALPPLVLVHGWMDIGASYQFLVDALTQDRYIIAPDWRGFGLSTGPACDHYWFPDYLADLDVLLDHYSPQSPVDLVGHSMGGNVVMLYAGIRPQRIRRLINLEGFGLPETKPEQAGERYGRWMDEIKSLHRGELNFKTYPTLQAVGARLQKNNPRLTPDRAAWLASHWAQALVENDTAQGYQLRGDNAHKVVGAQLYRLDEVLGIFRHITAPTLCVQGSDTAFETWWEGRYTFEQYYKRLEHVPQCERATIGPAGHMLHHDQPQALAELMEEFLAR